jgi:hypothetical protein
VGGEGSVTGIEVGLDELFEPPSEPDATRPARARREYVPKPDAVCVNAGDDQRHARRPCPYPGPRCASCGREHRRLQKQRAAERKVENTFGLTPAEYNALYEAQGGRCYVCSRANGKTKRLAVDHDHVLASLHGHDPKKACKFCVRGLACGWCNHQVLGRIGSNPKTYDRIANALRNPPARRLFGVKNDG